MKKLSVYVWIVVCFVCFAAFSVQAADPPAVGGQLPDFKLPTPKSSTDKNYLGVSGIFFSGPFTVPQIKAKVVILQIFSMYCPYCQKDAPHVNSLYNKIENDLALKGKIKLLGIGAGNSDYEVGLFKNKYQIPFPLFADGDFKIHKLMGEVRTPYFIGVKINPDGSHQVFYSRLGSIEKNENFLNEIISLSGLK
ncbi:MAG: redoxin [Deltaproteobacteria bacterium HGW-Deltaproteobacteria-11]|nr:MAG: redoxin [Deltaproteobacteria bacterium HGW-Deltaproteobacteria-11]